MRITTQNADAGLLMKLEGCLAGPWVHELDACWRDARERLDGHRIHVDLTAVCHVDAEGRELMTVMHRAGARFLTRGCLMPEIVREISEAAGGRRS